MASVAVGRMLVFHSFRSILDPIHPCRPYKRRGNMCKNPQLEKKGFKVLKSTWVDHSPKDRYGNILSDRSLKSSRWFFSSFRSVLDQNTNLYEKKTYRRILNWKETDFKVLKSKMTTVPTIDMEIICCAAWTTLILVQVDFRVSNCLPYDCILHIFWQLVYDFTWFDFYKRFHSFLKEFHQTLKYFILSSSRLSDLAIFYAFSHLSTTF